MISQYKLLVISYEVFFIHSEKLEKIFLLQTIKVTIMHVKNVG